MLESLLKINIINDIGSTRSAGLLAPCFNTNHKYGMLQKTVIRNTIRHIV